MVKDKPGAAAGAVMVAPELCYRSTSGKGIVMASKFEVYEDRAGKFRFRLKAANGEVVATGEAYETKSVAKKGCEAVQRAAASAEIAETDK